MVRPVLGLHVRPAAASRLGTGHRRVRGRAGADLAFGWDWGLWRGRGRGLRRGWGWGVGWGGGFGRGGGAGGAGGWGGGWGGGGGLWTGRGCRWRGRLGCCGPNRTPGGVSLTRSAA